MYIYIYMSMYAYIDVYDIFMNMYMIHMYLWNIEASIRNGKSRLQDSDLWRCSLFNRAGCHHPA